MRRLYLQLYLAIVTGLVAVVLTGGLLWRFAAERPIERHAYGMAAELASFLVPPASASRAESQEALSRLAERLKVDMALFDAARRPIAAAGRPLPPPTLRANDDDDEPHGGWVRGPGGPAWAINLPDRRWLVVRSPGQSPGRRALGLIGFLAIMGSVIALIAWPVARRLTRRLERLQESVDRLGQGDLAARVTVEGRDEVARLATSFNAAATRIASLVDAHKMLLANASHEIRTPLARIRLGIELMGEKPDPARAAALKADIAELDALVGELLLASRLDAVDRPEHVEPIDLLALAAEEAAHYPGAAAAGTPVVVNGDPALLRRLVRNLLDNAARHGKPPVEAEVHRERGEAVLTVSDAGTGIQPADRARVFEPFRRGTGTASGSGAGLGLALVARIAERHGGSAAVMQSGKGIVVRLPAP